MIWIIKKCQTIFFEVLKGRRFLVENFDKESMWEYFPMDLEWLKLTALYKVILFFYFFFNFDNLTWVGCEDITSANWLDALKNTDR